MLELFCIKIKKLYQFYTLNIFNIRYKDKIALWFIPITACLKPISFQELNWKKKLPAYRSLQYEHSRGYVREALSKILEIPALDIPIISPPGLPPRLPAEMGFVSFSHCRDVLLIGWSMKKIGVDIERKNRFFESRKILNKFFSRNEKKLLKDLQNKELNSEVLKLWVRKEAAIKWQKGSILRDLSKWIMKSGDESIENKVDGHILKSFLINHEQWYISVASNINLAKENYIICRY